MTVECPESTERGAYRVYAPDSGLLIGKICAYSCIGEAVGIKNPKNYSGGQLGAKDVEQWGAICLRERGGLSAINAAWRANAAVYSGRTCGNQHRARAHKWMSR